MNAMNNTSITRSEGNEPAGANAADNEVREGAHTNEAKSENSHSIPVNPLSLSAPSVLPPDTSYAIQPVSASSGGVTSSTPPPLSGLTSLPVHPTCIVFSSGHIAGGNHNAGHANAGAFAFPVNPTSAESKLPHLASGFGFLHRIDSEIKCPSIGEAAVQTPHGVRSPLHSPGHEYAEGVRQWLWQRQWAAAQMNWYWYVAWPLYSMNCAAAASAAAAAASMHASTMAQPAAMGAQVTGAQYRPQQQQRPADPAAAAAASQQQQQTAQPQRGREFTLPALWRRVAAEFVDFFLLLTMKLGVSLLALDYLDLVDIERYDLENLLTHDWDSTSAIAITTELIAMEIINRIFVCIFETLCLWRGLRGATPGKRFMRLQVISCLDIVDLPDNKVRIVPGGNLSLWNALIRSMMKNFSMAFLFPVCISVFFSPHKRASYDILAGSIVVDDDAWYWPRAR